MWRRKPPIPGDESAPAAPEPLREALRTARVEAAERTGVVADLHDAEIARLELLNEALDPVFADLPAEADMFDRGISKGETPRLWIDAVAHVHMGHDRRVYRFVQDSRFGRRALAESPQVPEIAAAVTHYVASRLIERERIFAGDAPSMLQDLRREAWRERRRRRRLVVLVFVLGVIVGALALLAAVGVFALYGP